MPFARSPTTGATRGEHTPARKCAWRRGGWGPTRHHARAKSEGGHFVLRGFVYAGRVVRRYIFVKLKPEYASGLKIVQLVKAAREVLPAAYGVQGLHVGRAADEPTRDKWDLCLTLEFVSDVDLDRSSRDPVTRAFLTSYLTPRSEDIWTAVFEGERSGRRSF